MINKFMRDDEFSSLAETLFDAFQREFSTQANNLTLNKRKKHILNVVSKKFDEKTAKNLEDLLTDEEVTNMYETCLNKIVEFKKKVLEDAVEEFYNNHKTEIRQKELFDRDRAIIEMMHGNKVAINGIENTYLFFSPENGTFNRQTGENTEVINIGEYNDDASYYLV